jgi:hypothetical protein
MAVPLSAPFPINRNVSAGESRSIGAALLPGLAQQGRPEKRKPYPLAGMRGNIGKFT